MTKNAPAGWYDDGSGRQRWWDGSVWTEHFAALPNPAGEPRPQKRTTPKTLATTKRWLLIAGLLILLVVGTSGGWGVLLGFVGFAGLVAGVIGLARGSLGLVGIRTRPVAAAVLTGALIVMMAGAGVSGANVVEVSSQSESRPLLAAPTATPQSTPSSTPTPVRVVKQEQEIEAIPFGSSTVDDANLDVGLSEVRTPGAHGERTITFEVVYVDGKEISRTKVGESVTKEPVDEVTAIGTRVPPPPPPPAPQPAAPSECDPNYEAACVPIAPDVDCAGGSGDGPAYVRGPVYVVGSDIYDLDRDGDGIACD